MWNWKGSGKATLSVNVTSASGYLLTPGRQRDGAALCAYFAWLEETLAQGVKINEYDAASKLEEFRS